MRVPVLEEIAKKVEARMNDRKRTLPLEKLAFNQTRHTPLPFESLFSAPGNHVIAEVKRASPSEGDIAPQADPVKTAGEYLTAGARALSILTEPDFFGGSIEYLKLVRAQFPQAPLLMKDFIVDEYQIYEGRLSGADAMLLIIAMHEEKKCRILFEKMKGLGLQVLVEVHDEEELKTALDLGATFIGVNNRNLKTMDVSLKTSERLVKLVPSNVTMISESGLKSAEEVRRLKMLGFKGFLMGTSFMKAASPGHALKMLLDGLS